MASVIRLTSHRGCHLKLFKGCRTALLNFCYMMAFRLANCVAVAWCSTSECCNTEACSHFITAQSNLFQSSVGNVHSASVSLWQWKKREGFAPEWHCKYKRDGILLNLDMPAATVWWLTGPQKRMSSKTLHKLPFVYFSLKKMKLCQTNHLSCYCFVRHQWK